MHRAFSRPFPLPPFLFSRVWAVCLQNIQGIPAPAPAYTEKAEGVEMDEKRPWASLALLFAVNILLILLFQAAA